MTQQLEKYFGCRVTLGNSITRSQYDSHLDEIRKALEAAKIAEDDVKIYLCSVRVSARDLHFDKSNLADRLSSMEISVRIGKRLHEKELMYFVNDRIRHKITDGISIIAEKFNVRMGVPGVFFAKRMDLDEAIYIILHNSLGDKYRNVRVRFLATPTMQFSRKLRNISTVSTSLDLYLDSQIQLRFDA
jgi:hypothetical protein